MAGEYTMPVLIKGEARRQAILDHLHAHPGGTRNDIVAALGKDWPAMSLWGSLTAMLKRGEVAADNSSPGKRFYAIARVTASAEELLAGKRERSFAAYCKRVQKDGRTVVTHKEAAERKRAAELLAERDAEARQRHAGPRVDPNQPWRMTHSCGDTAPAQDSRGQGAVREKVSVNCYQLF